MAPGTKTVQGSRIFIGPEPLPEFVDAVNQSGCQLVGSISEAEGVVWFGRDPSPLIGKIPAGVRWLQIPDAGAERWVNAGFLGLDLVLTSATGVYGQQVAEHALALVLACSHRLMNFARATKWDSEDPAVVNVGGSTVTIVGAGGIGSALLAILKPLGCQVIVVNRSGVTLRGADETISLADLHRVLPTTDILVLAAPSTNETIGLINKNTLALMKPTAMLVNVSRGNLVVTDDLISTLDEGKLSAVGLDVTDPEPLPDGHPLFRYPRVLITPHVSNPPALKRSSFAGHVARNCRLFREGQPLICVVDKGRGY